MALSLFVVIHVDGDLHITALSCIDFDAQIGIIDARASGSVAAFASLDLLYHLQ